MSLPGWTRQERTRRLRTSSVPVAQTPTNPASSAGMLREAIVTGLPGETGAPPAEPHAPQAQQEGDEPVGAEPPRGDNPHGAD